VATVASPPLSLGHPFGGNHIQPGHFYSRERRTAAGFDLAPLERITMFLWLISPWEAARLSLEAQRVMASHFLGLASGQDRQRQEVLSDGGEALTPGLADPTIVASAATATTAVPMTTGRRKAVPVRKARGAIRTSAGTKERSHKKVKGQRTRRKGKSRSQ
jgi:hypothetical protein